MMDVTSFGPTPVQNTQQVQKAQQPQQTQQTQQTRRPDEDNSRADDTANGQEINTVQAQAQQARQSAADFTGLGGNINLSA